MRLIAGLELLLHAPQCGLLGPCAAASREFCAKSAAHTSGQCGMGSFSLYFIKKLKLREVN